MKYFVKTIVLLSALAFGGCQVVRDSDGFYTIQSRKKDVVKQQKQETNNKASFDAETISIKDTKRQEVEVKNVDTAKYINEPSNGGMEDKNTMENKTMEAVKVADDENKQPNRFVVETENKVVEKECQCKCDVENNIKQQENTLTEKTMHKNRKMLYIQVGVYSHFDMANAFADNLRDNGINNVRLIDEDNTTKVVIGGFANKKDGQKTINKLYDIGIYDYFWKEIRE